MTTQTGVRPPLAALLVWLATHEIQHEVHRHPPTYTARDAARAEHVDPHTFAKAIAVEADDGRRAMLALEAADMLDLVKAARIMKARHVRLLTEAEIVALAPSCDPGTLPPVGELVGLPTYADHALRDEAWLTMQAGSHDYAVRLDRESWERAGSVRYADLAEEKDARPRWARS